MRISNKAVVVAPLPCCPAFIGGLCLRGRNVSPGRGQLCWRVRLRAGTFRGVVVRSKRRTLLRLIYGLQEDGRRMYIVVRGGPWMGGLVCRVAMILQQA